MKIVPVVVMLSLFGGVANASSMTHDERHALLDNVPRLMGEHMSDHVIASCWDEAKSGDEQALLSLAVIAQARKTISEIYIKRSEATSGLKTSEEKADVLLSVYSKQDHQRLKKVMSTLPFANNYCIKIKEKKDKAE